MANLIKSQRSKNLETVMYHKKHNGKIVAFKNKAYLSMIPSLYVRQKETLFH